MNATGLAPPRLSGEGRNPESAAGRACPDRSRDLDGKIDVERYRRSMARLEAIFRSINDTANEVSTRRCPYANARDRCTAGFGCRNQRRTTGGGEELPLCAGTDDLNYRSAWEV